MIGRLLCRLGRHRHAAVRWRDERHFDTVCDRGCGHVFSSNGFAPIPPRSVRRRLARSAAKRIVASELPRKAVEDQLWSDSA